MENRGSKPGERRGGRQRGTPNKVTAETRAALAASGLLPLDYMLDVMRDNKAEKPRRDAMAKAAAPYLHPTLSSIAHTGPTGSGPVEVDHRHQVESEVDALLSAAEGPKASADG